MQHGMIVVVVTACSTTITKNINADVVDEAQPDECEMKYIKIKIKNRKKTKVGRDQNKPTTTKDIILIQ